MSNCDYKLADAAGTKRSGTMNRNGSVRAGGATSGGGSGQSASFRVRSVKAWKRPDEEIDLPLDRDALAPALKVKYESPQSSYENL